MYFDALTMFGLIAVAGFSGIIFFMASQDIPQEDRLLRNACTGQGEND